MVQFEIQDRIDFEEAWRERQCNMLLVEDWLQFVDSGPPIEIGWVSVQWNIAYVQSVGKGQVDNLVMDFLIDGADKEKEGDSDDEEIVVWIVVDDGFLVVEDEG